MRESEVEKHLMWAVARQGGVTYKVKALGRPGFPDRVVILPGREIWLVELKTKGGRLSAVQKRFAEEMKRLGAMYVCLWTTDQIDAWL